MTNTRRTSYSVHIGTRHVMCGYSSGQHVFKIATCSACDIVNPKILHIVRYNHALLSACKTVIGIVCDTY
jgi:hypothetical protein